MSPNTKIKPITTTNTNFKQKSNTILIVGETGSGKSTFINTLTNYFFDGEFPNNIKVSIDTKYRKSTQGLTHSELNVKDTTSSQTDKCTLYKFKKDDTNYVFIDTPGLSDTRGVSQDEINMTKIIDAAENAVSLSAIVIVINGKDCRDVLSLKNAITRLQGAIPDQILNNLMIVFTKCREDNRNFDLKALGSLQSHAIFHMENSAFSTDPTTWTSSSKKLLKMEFKASMHTVERLLKHIEKKSMVSTQVFADMKSMRFHIKQTLHKAKLDIKRIQSLQEDVAKAQTELGGFSNDANKFQKYTTQTQVTRRVIYETPFHSTICSRCDFVCHSGCGLQEITSKGSNAFIGCVAMGGGGVCTCCPERCSYVEHYHGRKAFREVTDSLQQEIAEMKFKYQQANHGVISTQTKINSIADAQKLVQDALKHMTDEIVKSCHDLKKICKGFNIVDELYITLQQMEMEAKMLTSHQARQAAEQMINTVKLISDSLSNNSSISIINSNKKNAVDDNSDDDSYDDYDYLLSDDSDDDDSDNSSTSTISTSAPNDAIMLFIQQQQQQLQLLIQQQTLQQSQSPAGLEQQILQLQLQLQRINSKPTTIEKQQPGVIVPPCKVCQKAWTMTLKDQKFFVEAGIPLTKTCVECRKDKKNAKPFNMTTAGAPPVNPKKVLTQPQALLPANFIITQDVTNPSCKVCQQPWVLSASERAFFNSKSIPLPKTCHTCRDKIKASKQQ